MKITEKLIQNINSLYDDDSLKLTTNFFIIFSRFEFALKESITFANPRNGKVEADWSKFVSTIKMEFNQKRTSELADAVNYILNCAPRHQTLTDGVLNWVNRPDEPTKPEINKLEQYIRDIRNNLFHGCKFNNILERDVSRDPQLLSSALIVLEEWLSLSETIKELFLRDLE